MYNKIIDKNNSGKTNKLIEQAMAKNKDNYICIVCDSPERMKERINSLGYTIYSNVAIITYEQYIYTYNGEYEGYLIYIDDMDKFLYKYDPMIECYTLSTEE